MRFPLPQKGAALCVSDPLQHLDRPLMGQDVWVGQDANCKPGSWQKMYQVLPSNEDQGRLPERRIHSTQCVPSFTTERARVQKGKPVRLDPFNADPGFIDLLNH